MVIKFVLQTKLLSTRKIIILNAKMEAYFPHSTEMFYHLLESAGRENNLRAGVAKKSVFEIF
jgi:hypothetical protein